MASYSAGTANRISNISDTGRAPWVGRLWVGQDVDQVRHSRVERAIECRRDLRGVGHGLAGPAECACDAVVRRLRRELGGDVVPVEESHRVLLQTPAGVVPD